MNKAISLTEAKKLYGKENVRNYGSRQTMIPVGYKTPIKLANDFDGAQLEGIEATATFTGTKDIEHSHGATTNLCWSIEITSPIQHTMEYSMGSGHARLLLTSEFDDFQKWSSKRYSRSLSSLLEWYNEKIHPIRLDGSAIKVAPDIPTLDSIIYSMIVDASLYDQCDSIDDFASDLGYSIDHGITKIQESHAACAVAHKKLGHLRNRLDISEDDLNDLFQDY